MDVLEEVVCRLVDEYGAARLTGAAMSLFLAVAGAGVLAQSAVLTTVAAVLVALAAAATLILQRRRIRRLQTIADSSDAVTDSFLNTLVELGGFEYRLKSWKEVQVLSRAKGLRAERDIEIVATGSAELRVVLHSQFVCDGKSASPRDRRSVRASARRIDDSGEAGARLPTLYKWSSDRLRLYIRLPVPLKPGQGVKLRIEIDWPDYGTPLERGATDTYTMSFLRPCDKFDWSFFLDADWRVAKLRASTTSGFGAPVVSIRDKGFAVNLAVEGIAKGRYEIVLDSD